VAAVLAPRARFDMSSAGGGPASVRTGEEIAAGWEQGLASIRSIHHQAGNYRVRVDGDRAEAFCYGIAYHHLPNPSGRDTRVFVGSYDFELEMMDGRWRITVFRYTLKFIDGNRDLESSRGQPPGLPLCSRLRAAFRAHPPRWQAFRTREAVSARLDSS
jgi:hypothetical protein